MAEQKKRLTEMVRHDQVGVPLEEQMQGLLRINPDTVSDIFIYIIHRYPCFLISFAQPVPAA